MKGQFLRSDAVFLSKRKVDADLLMHMPDPDIVRSFPGPSTRRQMQSKICALAESLPLCIQRVSLRFRLISSPWPLWTSQSEVA